jgi:hypothetical protein
MQLEIQVKVFVRLNFMSRSPAASRPPFVAIPNYIPQGYMSDNSKTRESRLFVRIGNEIRKSTVFYSISTVSFVVRIEFSAHNCLEAFQGPCFGFPNRPYF